MEMMLTSRSLAWAELRLTFAYVFHRFGRDMKLAASRYEGPINSQQARH